MQLVYLFLIWAEQLRKRFRVRRYTVAVASVFFAVVITQAFNTVLSTNAPLLIFVSSVFLSAWYGGFGPGMAATILSLFIVSYFYINPQFSFISKDPTDVIRLSIFFVQGVLISLLSESRNRYEKEKDQLLKTAEKALKSRDQFTSVISHELKTPITSQKAYLQLLRNVTSKRGDKEYNRYIKKIEEQLNRQTRLINNLQDVSKIQAGKFQLQYESFQLDKYIREIVEELQTSTPTHQFIVKGQIKRTIVADKERIRHVLTNLMINAVKYSPKAKKVVIELIERQRIATVNVIDKGIGISKESQKNLFLPFYRTQEVKDEKFEGSGLGLFIAAEIIKQHNGKIAVRSNEGKGSTFSFSLPLKNSA